jgi:peptidoglycan/LPS O-acetylase OafA/YrhL
VLSAIAGRPGWIAVALATLVVGVALDASWWVDVAAAWLVLALALTDAPAVRALLANRVVRHVGLVSYGMYMTHMFAVNGARRLLHAHEGPLVFALALPLSVALGTATHYGFERWFLRKKDSAGRPRGREVLA